MDEATSAASRGLEALWEHALQRWDDVATHQAFLEMCEAQNDLAFAARRYRSVLADPRHAEAAQVQLDKITALAFSRIDAARSAPKQGKRGITLAACAVSLLLIAFSLYFASR